MTKKTTNKLIRAGLALAGFAALQPTAIADAKAKPTFTEDIAPIIYNNCTECHRTGQAAPFTLKSYNDANQITLPPCNPIKLGLALNFSIFHYEVMKNHKQACELADKALQEALDKIDELEEDDFRDAKSIIELLKENLTLWKEEEDGGNDIDDL